MISNFLRGITSNKSFLSSFSFSSLIVSCLYLQKLTINHKIFQRSFTNNLELQQKKKKEEEKEKRGKENSQLIKELVYLQLFIPMSGTKGMPISLYNDNLLSTIIKGFFLCLLSSSHSSSHSSSLSSSPSNNNNNLIDYRN